MGLSDRLSALLMGTPVGQVTPAPVPRRGNDKGGRYLALCALRAYIGELTFYRTGAEGGLPIPFQVPASAIHFEQPDNEDDKVWPSINVVADGEGELLARGFAPWVNERSKDVFAKRTVLQVEGEHSEEFHLQVNASSRAERRALMEGLRDALTAPTEGLFGTRLRVPGYWCEPVVFTVLGETWPDDGEAAVNRRYGLIKMHMRFDRVQLIDAVTLRPVAVVETIDSGEL